MSLCNRAAQRLYLSTSQFLVVGHAYGVFACFPSSIPPRFCVRVVELDKPGMAKKRAFHGSMELICSILELVSNLDSRKGLPPTYSFAFFRFASRMAEHCPWPCRDDKPVPSAHAWGSVCLLHGLHQRRNPYSESNLPLGSPLKVPKV